MPFRLTAEMPPDEQTHRTQTTKIQLNVLSKNIDALKNSPSKAGDI
jgi:hypothetical protein